MILFLQDPHYLVPINYFNQCLTGLEGEFQVWAPLLKHQFVLLDLFWDCLTITRKAFLFSSSHMHIRQSNYPFDGRRVREVSLESGNQLQLAILFACYVSPG